MAPASRWIVLGAVAGDGGARKEWATQLAADLRENGIEIVEIAEEPGGEA